MPFTLRLTNDGVAIHGSDVAKGAATHGCLGVPVEFAKLLFDQMRVGDEVLVVQDTRAHVIT
jgi:lipoprotein-anchoring transpeptidase ErfK/SrfK